MAARGRFIPKNPGKYMGHRLKCLLCDREFDNKNGLSRHIIWTHKITTEQYYVDHIKGLVNTCIRCGDSTKFLGIIEGYAISCGHSCSQFMNRERIKADKDKYAEYNKNISKAVGEIWKTREVTGENINIRKKIGESIKRNNLLLSKDEMNMKYGWLNKLSGDEYEKAVKNDL